GEAPGRAGGEVAALERRGELDGLEEDSARRLEALARERTAPSGLEGLGRGLRQLGRARAVELEVDRARLLQMVRADLEQLLAGPVGEPVGECLVQLGAGRLRERRVRDLADQDVLEPVRALARDRRPRLLEDELAEEEVVEEPVEPFEVGGE